MTLLILKSPWMNTEKGAGYLASISMHPFIKSLADGMETELMPMAGRMSSG